NVTTDGWNTQDGGSYGGITFYNGEVYVTDMKVGGDKTKGILRFDPLLGTWKRELSGKNYIDLTMGLDGLMYGLKKRRSRVDVINPVDMTVVRTLSLGDQLDLSAVVADAQGNIFAASRNGMLYSFDSNGVALVAADSGYYYLTDLDLNADGVLLVGIAYDGFVLITDTTLTYLDEIMLPNMGTTFATFSPEPAGTSYCDAAAVSNRWEWIAGVQIGTFNNTSNIGGYSDYTSMVIDLTKGQSVDIQLTPGFEDVPFIQMWKIWIDYNQDGDFEDAGEEVFSDTYDWLIRGNFTVPADAATGQTRMRVVMQKGTWPTACGEFQSGEVEDYTVNIQ
ncbi:MAG: hypothetical protein GY765_43310, partial [bacterium]|nr:hypothetical protein [bacterium]